MYLGEVEGERERRGEGEVQAEPGAQGKGGEARVQVEARHHLAQDLMRKFSYIHIAMKNRTMIFRE